VSLKWEKGGGQQAGKQGNGGPGDNKEGIGLLGKEKHGGGKSAWTEGEERGTIKRIFCFPGRPDNWQLKLRKNLLRGRTFGLGDDYGER